MDIDKLKTFLVKSTREGYASGGGENINESDGSTTIIFEEGDR